MKITKVTVTFTTPDTMPPYAYDPLLGTLIERACTKLIRFSFYLPETKMRMLALVPGIIINDTFTQEETTLALRYFRDVYFPKYRYTNCTIQNVEVLTFNFSYVIQKEHADQSRVETILTEVPGAVIIPSPSILPSMHLPSTGKRDKRLFLILSVEDIAPLLEKNGFVFEKSDL